jgi:glycosyltransferase involved in cell wall biosynthesis
MAYTGTVVVIPTRNRAQLAMNAIASVLEQPLENLSVMVSDNSTSESDREALAEFCRDRADERLRYVRPPISLSMSAHWAWAIEEALRSYSASHFLYLTDRMMFRKRALTEIASVATRYPDRVISYNHDRIVDNVTPVRVEQQPATEQLLAVATSRLVWLLSQAVIHPAVPRMLNCIAPRTILERIRERFGNVFASFSPDFNFCCRCLDVEESILYFDKAPIFHYALSRSNGASVTRGETTADNADFTANAIVEDAVINSATPIPGLSTAVNYAFNEYCLFKQQTNSAKFPELDLPKYLQANAIEIRELVDPQLRAELLELLVAHGYNETETDGPRDAAEITLGERVQSKVKRVLSGPSTTPAWLFLARTLAVAPPGYNNFEFATLTAAIDYAKNISRGNVLKEAAAEQELLQGRELPKR